MAVDFRKFSRLRFQLLLEIDGFEFWDMLEPPTIEPQPDDALYRVQKGDRIDLLANKFYGDPILWWVLAVANGLELLPLDLQNNLVLRIPSQRYVQQVLFNKVIQ